MSLLELENVFKNITDEEIDYFINNAKDNTDERIKKMTCIFLF